MDYSKFYTPTEIADLLIKQLEINPPNSVVDICCGRHNLLYSAKQIWPKAQFVGVDVIEHLVDDIDCIQSDGRKFAIEHSNQFSLILANPPFAYVNKKREYPELYNNLPFRYSTSRLENEMLLANLRLLNSNATLLIIMPRTFINAKNNLEIRKYISSTYHVKKVIRLPDGVFGSSKISSCALIIRKADSNYSYTSVLDVMGVEKEYTVSKPVYVRKKQMDAGYWDTDYMPTMSSRLLNSRRGTISSSYFAHSGIPILHTARLQPQWKPSIRYVNENISSSIYAEDGDIIVNRIGKAAGQWCIYTGDPILISDCLYRIKDPGGDIAKKLTGNVYSSPLRGVATRYITMDDFDAWYKSIE